MTEFLCRLGTSGGDILEKVYNSETSEKLRMHLEGEGFHVFRIERNRPAFLEMFPFLKKGTPKLDIDAFLVFNQELEALLRSGLPVLQGLDLLLERMKDSPFRTALEQVASDVRGGNTLSEAFEARGEFFPRVYYASLRAGERSGSLSEVLRRFVKATKTIRDARRKIVSAMIYPVLLLSLAAIIVVVLFYVAIPQFKKMFEQFNSELPLITQIVISTGDLVTRYGLWVFLAVMGGLAMYKTYRQTEAGQYRMDGLKLRLPVLGPLTQKINVAQFARILGTLVSGGIPAVQAMDISGQSLGNTKYRVELRRATERIREGAPIHLCLEETGLFEALSVEMVKVGESSGSLPDMLYNLADFYDDDIDNQLTRLVAIIEPAILIILSLIVLLILISLYLPIFETMRLT